MRTPGSIACATRSNQVFSNVLRVMRGLPYLTPVAPDPFLPPFSVDGGREARSLVANTRKLGHVWAKCQIADVALKNITRLWHKFMGRFLEGAALDAAGHAYIMAKQQVFQLRKRRRHLTALVQSQMDSVFPSV